MTEQTSNSILYKGKKYIVGLTNPAPDDYFLKILNIHLSEPDTSCKRGYIAKYKIQNNLLKLLHLDIFPSKPQNVRINSKLPSSFIDGWEVYKYLYLRIPFTGEMEIFRTVRNTEDIFINEAVIESFVFFRLQFVDGMLKNVKDITADKVREEFDTTNDSYEEIPEFLQK